MKVFKSLLILVFSMQVFANIPDGNYKAEKIQCKSGKVMKLGGKFMSYEIFLKVAGNTMTMTAHAKSAEWAPFKLQCVQTNQGHFHYTQNGQYEGDLPNISAECNNAAWTSILKKKLFGVEQFGTFEYTVSNNELIIKNKDTITKYSCDQADDYPIYYYKKLTL